MGVASDTYVYGIDGINGIDGVDGTDGVDGVDGLDGKTGMRLLEATGSIAGDSVGYFRYTFPAGTTLGDIQSISWWTFLIQGYIPHVDIALDVDGDGVRDHYMTAEGAHINNNSITGWIINSGWIQTFDGASLVYTPWATWLTGAPTSGTDVNDSTAVWLSGVGGGGAVGNLDTFGNYKSGLNTLTPSVNASTSVLYMDIEVDNWVVISRAFISTIKVNGVVVD